ncbi:hypothetical protein ACOMHN_025425 [Nucella lapillus]
MHDSAPRNQTTEKHALPPSTTNFRKVRYLRMRVPQLEDSFMKYSSAISSNAMCKKVFVQGRDGSLKRHLEYVYLLRAHVQSLPWCPDSAENDNSGQPAEKVKPPTAQMSRQMMHKSAS